MNHEGNHGTYQLVALVHLWVLHHLSSVAQSLVMNF